MLPTGLIVCISILAFIALFVTVGNLYDQYTRGESQGGAKRRIKYLRK